MASLSTEMTVAVIELTFPLAVVEAASAIVVVKLTYTSASGTWHETVWVVEGIPAGRSAELVGPSSATCFWRLRPVLG